MPMRPITIRPLWETEGEAISAFVRGCFDVGFGCLISFDPSERPGGTWSVCMHKGPRFSGGDVRIGWGDTFEAAMQDCAASEWGPGMTISEGVVVSPAGSAES